MLGLKQPDSGIKVMRAVIFAAALLAGASGWLWLETDARTSPTITQIVTPSNSASLRRSYRAEAAECRGGEKRDRAACERRARERVLATLRHEAARVSLR